MVRVLSILILILLSTTVWCSQIGVGVDMNKVVIWEYWKFEDGLPNHELLIFNPSKEGMKVVFRKWYQRKDGEPERIYTNKDVLLRTKRIRPNNYVQFATAVQEMRGLHRGLIEVLVNGQSAGLYDLDSGLDVPLANIENGIVITRRSNVGNGLQYEIIYMGLDFERNAPRSAKVYYLEADFYSSGFIKGGKYNPFNIKIENVSVDNLVIGNRADFDLDLVATGVLGSFEVEFKNFDFKARIVHRDFNYMINAGTGQTIAFNIPVDICFDNKRKYKSRR